MKREELETFMTLLYDNKINEIKEFLNTKQEILNDVTPMGTLIEIAASEGKKDIVDYLIEKGSDVNLGGGLEESPLVEALFEDTQKLLICFCQKVLKWMFLLSKQTLCLRQLVMARMKSPLNLSIKV